MPLSQTLWQRNSDLAEACLRHPFVRGLADGSLAREAFKRYVAQDAFYLRSFARAYAVIAAKCPTVEDLAVCSELLAGVIEELKLHAEYARSLGIDLNGVRPMPTTRAYTDFLLATAWQEPIGRALAAMTPCMRLYEYLGSALAHSATPGAMPSSAWACPGPPYRQWIDTYSSADFADLVRKIETLLNAHAEDEPPVADAYRHAMRCELDFFSEPMRT